MCSKFCYLLWLKKSRSLFKNKNNVIFSKVRKKLSKTHERVFCETVLEISVLFAVRTAVRVCCLRDQYLFVPYIYDAGRDGLSFFVSGILNFFLLGIWVNMVLRINKTFFCLVANFVTFYISNNLKNLEMTRVSIYERTRVEKFS